MFHLCPLDLQAFTEALMLLTSLTDKRQAEVASPRQRERMGVAMTTLRKCVPMMSTALQTFVKYPHNVQATVSYCPNMDIV